MGWRRHVASDSLAAGLLFLPYAACVLFLTVILPATVVGEQITHWSRGEVDELFHHLTWLTYAGWVGLSVLLAVVVRPDEPRGSGLAAVSRRLFWWLALPARLWLWVWLWVLRFFLAKPLLSFAVSALVFPALFGLALALSAGVIGVIVGVAALVVASSMTFGGYRWANQYGSGYKGGSNAGVLMALVAVLLGILVWLIAVSGTFKMVALPAFVYVMDVPRDVGMLAILDGSLGLSNQFLVAVAYPITSTEGNGVLTPDLPSAGAHWAVVGAILLGGVILPLWLERRARCSLLPPVRGDLLDDRLRRRRRHSMPGLSRGRTASRGRADTAKPASAPADGGTDDSRRPTTQGTVRRPHASEPSPTRPVAVASARPVSAPPSVRSTPTRARRAEPSAWGVPPVRARRPLPDVRPKKKPSDLEGLAGLVHLGFAARPIPATLPNTPLERNPTMTVKAQKAQELRDFIVDMAEPVKWSEVTSTKARRLASNSKALPAMCEMAQGLVAIGAVPWGNPADHLWEAMREKYQEVVPTDAEGEVTPYGQNVWTALHALEWGTGSEPFSDLTMRLPGVQLGEAFSGALDFVVMMTASLVDVSPESLYERLRSGEFSTDA